MASVLSQEERTTGSVSFAIARELSWSPDASFRERDQELGEEFTASLFAPDGTLIELPASVLQVLSAFGFGATAIEVCDRLALPADQVGVIVELARTLEERRLLVPTPETAAATDSAVAPTLLVTAHGCGGTLLRFLLDAHPRLACAPPHRFGNRLREMVDRASQTDGFSSLELDRGPYVRSLGNVVGRLLTLHAHLRQKDAWVWASRDHDLCLEFLDELFGREGRFLCVVRHPLDAADSSARRYAQEGWQATRMIDEISQHDDPHVAYAHYWASVFGRIRAFRELQPERVLVVRYEDLVRRTEETLAEVFSFCGLSTPPTIVADAFARPHEMLEGGWESFAFEGQSEVRDDQIGLWRTWDERLLSEAIGVVEGEMSRWGYSLDPGVAT